MWPQTLQMSRDECRGMLRRLELESYSHIISVFRAQGCLSEPKAKLLEELRQYFHITMERHRAEVRRAVNDEQLCTIAENVCGPNTWQEWSREGRRPYPLLPRIDPQTALTIVANDLAAKAFAENAKLAAPAETGANLKEAMLDQATYVALKHGKAKKQDPPHVVMEEPFKVPDVPNEVKKATLKRKEIEGESKPNKKRSTQHEKQQLLQQSLANIEDGHAQEPEEGRKLSARTLQNRFFYQQQQKHKQRMSSKKATAAGALTNHSGGLATNKRTAAPAKSGRRRAQKQLQQQKQQQQLQQQQQHQHQPQLQLQQQAQPKVLLGAENAPTALANHVANYHEVQPHVEYILDEALKSVSAVPTPTSPVTPNFAKGKHIGAAGTRLYTPSSATERVEIGSPTQRTVFANSPIVFKEKLPPQQQQQQLITPVKKYIVEERPTQPAAATPPATSIAVPSSSNSGNSNNNISTANLPLAPQIISVQQIPAPSLGSKLRATTAATTTTILPAGTKLTPKKVQLLELEGKPKATPSTAVRLLPYDQQQQLHPPSLGNLSKVDKQTAVQKYIVEERPPNQTIATLSPTSLTALGPVNASTVNIIKNIPAASLNNTLITPLAAPNPTNPNNPNVPNVFRKAATNINIKAINATGASSGTNSVNATQLLGNIKLNAGPTSGAQTFNIKQVPSSALRNIKFCSSNGKVFLQQAKIPAGSIIHKLNNASSGVATNSSALSPTGAPTSTQPAQRITIQKMQILTPSQVISSAAGGTSSGTGVTTTIVTSSAGAGAKVKPTTLTFATATGSKNNLVILPVSASSNMRTVTLAAKPVTKIAGEVLATPKPNVLVIGSANATAAVATTTTTVAATPPQQQQQLVVSSSNKPKAHQLITEDTPIDIINMPIIVADNNGSVSSSTDAKARTTLKATTTGPQPLVVLNTTDWEVELDQASKATTVKGATSTTNSSAPKGNSNPTLEEVIVECSNENNVIEEQEQQQQDQQQQEQVNNRIIELDDESVEYVDMDLDQPIEIQSTSNLESLEELGVATTMVTTTTTSLKTAIMSTQLYDGNDSQMPQKLQAAQDNATAGTTTIATAAAVAATTIPAATTMTTQP